MVMVLSGSQPTQKQVDQQSANEFIQRQQRLQSQALASGQTPKQAQSTQEQIQGGEIAQKELNPLTPVSQVQANAQQTQDFKTKQAQSDAELKGMLGTEQKAGIIQRLSQAGLIAPVEAGNFITSQFEQTLNNLGINAKFGRQNVKDLSKTTAGQALGVGILGSAAGASALYAATGVAPAIITTFVGTGGTLLVSGNIKETQTDISKVTAATRIIMSGVAKGGDVYSAIDTLNKTEAKVRADYNNLNGAIDRSPKDLIAGVDSGEEMYYDLQVITTRRKILENFAASKDMSLITPYLNESDATDIQQ